MFKLDAFKKKKITKMRFQNYKKQKIRSGKGENDKAKTVFRIAIRHATSM